MEDNNCLVWHFVNSLKKLYEDKWDEYVKRAELRKYLSHKKRVPKQLTNQVINELYELGFLKKGKVKCKYKLDYDRVKELENKVKYNKKVIENA